MEKSNALVACPGCHPNNVGSFLKITVHHYAQPETNDVRLVSEFQSLINFSRTQCHVHPHPSMTLSVVKKWPLISGKETARQKKPSLIKTQKYPLVRGAQMEASI